MAQHTTDAHLTARRDQQAVAYRFERDGTTGGPVLLRGYYAMGPDMYWLGHKEIAPWSLSAAAFLWAAIFRRAGHKNTQFTAAHEVKSHNHPSVRSFHPLLLMLAGPGLEPSHPCDCTKTDTDKDRCNFI